MSTPVSTEVLKFTSRREWAAWLERNHRGNLDSVWEEEIQRGVHFACRSSGDRIVLRLDRWADKI